MKEVKFKEKRATSRMGYLPIEGGGLNASYTTVDAVANICATAGNLGMKYGKDFIWSGTDFLHLALQNDHRIKHTNTGKIKLIKERK